MPITLLYTTVKNKLEAENLASKLLEERLIACANIHPSITSLYRWQGAVEKEPEVPILLKTHTDRVDAAMARIAELHPYDTPCILTLPIDKADPSFVEWIFSNTRD